MDKSSTVISIASKVDALRRRREKVKKRKWTDSKIEKEIRKDN